jgi:hypothetical protein
MLAREFRHRKVKNGGRFQALRMKDTCQHAEEPAMISENHTGNHFECNRLVGSDRGGRLSAGRRVLLLPG